MKKLRFIWTIPILLLFLIPLPVYADDGCGDAGCEDGCDMEVNIDVSGNSEVNVNTGDNSEVEVNTGACNDVYINGQDINEPTVIHHQRTSYNAYYSSRLSKLEYWRVETIEALQITMDGLAKMIVVSEGKNGELDTLNQRLEGLLMDITSQDEGLSSLRAEVIALDAGKDAEISSLKFQIELLKWENDNQERYLLLLFISLITGFAITGGLLQYYRRGR